MALTGINRKFGIGETREANAVDTVYTADELRAALGRIYARPNGVGTIRIGGDIVLSEPIRIKTYNIDDGIARSITIEGVNGAKIQRAPATPEYYWGTAYSDPPVFIVDELGTDGYCATAITLRDLVIGGDGSPDWGALVAGDTAGTGDQWIAPVIRITDCTLGNTHAVFGAFSSTASFTDNGSGTFGAVVWYGATVDGLILRVGDTSAVTGVSLGSKYSGFYYADVRGVGAANAIEAFDSNKYLILRPNPLTQGCTLSGISSKVQFVPYTAADGRVYGGDDNTITGASVVAWGDVTGWNTIGAAENHIFYTEDATTAHHVAADAPVSDGVGSFTPGAAVKSTWTTHSDGNGSTTAHAISGFLPNTQYNAEWRLVYRWYTGANADLANAYIIRAVIVTDGLAAPTVLKTQTDWAGEAVPGVISGLFPTATPFTVYIAPTDSSGDRKAATATITLDGWGLIQ